jgi:hypothetical protein
LYLGPPTNALVLSIYEKPSIQALERKTGYVHTSSGKIVRDIKSTYKCHDTVNLFAALNVATGTIQTKITAIKKRPDFQAFLDDVMAEVPTSQQVHVILDNYATHKKNDNWLARHPNIPFDFTPALASWLNQVDICFGIFTRKSLSCASFQSTEQLAQATKAFVKQYNENAAPFVWRKREVKDAQIRNTIVNLCNQTLAMISHEQAWKTCQPSWQHHAVQRPCQLDGRMQVCGQQNQDVVQNLRCGHQSCGLRGVQRQRCYCCQNHGHPDGARHGR